MTETAEEEYNVLTEHEYIMSQYNNAESTKIHREKTIVLVGPWPYLHSSLVPWNNAIPCASPDRAPVVGDYRLVDRIRWERFDGKDWAESASPAEGV